MQRTSPKLELCRLIRGGTDYVMGVKDLKKLLRRHAPHVMLPARPLHEYTNCTFAVDVAGIMHRYKHAMYSDEQPYAYLNRILQQYNEFQSNNIACIYVFDGPKPTCKLEELGRRNNQHRQAAQQFQDAHNQFVAFTSQFTDMDTLTRNSAIATTTTINVLEPTTNTNESALSPSPEKTPVAHIEDIDHKDIKNEGATRTVELDLKTYCARNGVTPAHTMKQLSETIVKLKKRIATVTFEDVAALQSLFNHYDVPYVVATGESEKTCAWMTQMKMADLVLADDTDTLPYGATRVLMHLGSTKHEAIEIVLDDVLKSLDLSMREFIDMCIMCGCDFVKLPGIASGRALQMVRTHKSVENWLRHKYTKKTKDGKKPSESTKPDSSVQHPRKRTLKKSGGNNQNYSAVRIIQINTDSWSNTTTTTSPSYLTKQLSHLPKLLSLPSAAPFDITTTSHPSGTKTKLEDKDESFCSTNSDTALDNNVVNLQLLLNRVQHAVDEFTLDYANVEYIDNRPFLRCIL